MSSTPETIQENLNSEDFGDRLSGVNQLRQLDPKVAFPMIVPLIQDPHVRVRYAAVSQLDTLGVADPEKSLELLRERLQNEPEADVKAAAADVIGALKLTDGFDDLVQLYNSTTDWMVRMSIVAGVGVLGDPRGFELLKEAIATPEPLVQLAAVSAFGDLGDPAAIELLVPFIANDDWQIRQRLVQALSRLDTPESTEALQTLAKDEMEQVSNYAQECLAQR